MTINCKGKLIDLTVPRVMGIVNITPDSFFAGSRHRHADEIIANVAQMIRDGAAFIDIGGYSSRPGAAFVSEQEEIRRVVPVVELLVAHFPDIMISVDTFRSEVARVCIQNGAAMINDISAGMLDDKMLATVAGFQVPYIMMHMRGNPQTMQQFTHYEDVVREMLLYFSERIASARALGINDLIADPGFGFSKTLAQNFEVLGKLGLFDTLEVPVLAGLSRKSMIQKTLGVDANDALNGTTVLNTIALAKGASILRVHDVREAVQAVQLVLETGKA